MKLLVLCLLNGVVAAFVYATIGRNDGALGSFVAVLAVTASYVIGHFASDDK